MRATARAHVQKVGDLVPLPLLLDDLCLGVGWHRGGLVVEVREVTAAVGGGDDDDDA